MRMGTPLWLTVPGTSRWVPVAWLSTLVLAVLLGPLAIAHLGIAGAVLLVLGAGWLVARRADEPSAWLRRYHLDDTEVTEMGPGTRVRRLAWSAVDTVVQEPSALALRGEGTVLRVPLVPLLERGVWGVVLARVVPEIADDLWALLEEGEVVPLVPDSAPSSTALAWWAYAPVLAMVAAGGGPTALALAAGLATAERALAAFRARLGTITLQRTGITLRRGLRPRFIAWSQAGVTCGAHGTTVAVDGAPAGRIAAALPNYWAAAPVIELRAHLGAGSGANVHFRVRVAEGRLAVVGEVEPTA